MARPPVACQAPGHAQRPRLEAGRLDARRARPATRGFRRKTVGGPARAGPRARATARLGAEPLQPALGQPGAAASPRWSASRSGSAARVGQRAARPRGPAAAAPRSRSPRPAARPRARGPPTPTPRRGRARAGAGSGRRRGAGRCARLVELAPSGRSSSGAERVVERSRAGAACPAPARAGTRARAAVEAPRRRARPGARPASRRRARCRRGCGRRAARGGRPGRVSRGARRARGARPAANAAAGIGRAALRLHLEQRAAACLSPQATTMPVAIDRRARCPGAAAPGRPARRRARRTLSARPRRCGGRRPARAGSRARAARWPRAGRLQSMRPSSFRRIGASVARRVVLRLRRARVPPREAVEGLDEQLGAQPRQPRLQLRRRLLGTDRRRPGQQQWAPCPGPRRSAWW